MANPQTLYDKIWNAHVVRVDEHGTTLLYIDRQLVHEVTSAQAFEGLRLADRKPRRPEANLAVPDHNVPTTDRHLGIVDPVSRLQVETLEAELPGVRHHAVRDGRQTPGHRACGRAGGGLHAAGHDHRLRRSAIPPPTAPSARWPSVSAPPRWSMCWPLSACCRRSPRRCWSASTAT